MARTLAPDRARLAVAVAAARPRARGRRLRRAGRRARRRCRRRARRVRRARAAPELNVRDRPPGLACGRLPRDCSAGCCSGSRRSATRPARRPSRSSAAMLPVGRVRLRRRPRRAAAPRPGGRRDGLGLPAGVPRRLRGRAGGARAAVHVLRVPRRDRGAVTERGRRRRARARRDLPAVVPPARRRAAVLVVPPARRARPGGGRRRRRRGRRPARCGVLGPDPHRSIDGVGDVAFAPVLFVLLRLLPVWASSVAAGRAVRSGAARHAPRFYGRSARRASCPRATPRACRPGMGCPT